MNIRDRAKGFLLATIVATANVQWFKPKVFRALGLIIILIINVLPVQAVSTSFHPNNEPNLQTASTLTIVTNADAHVEELHPTANNGTSDYLQVEGANNRHTESYLRFTVNGVTGTVQSARLRVYATINSSTNGPALYRTGTTWTETGITWNNRPARTGGVIDNKGTISRNTWVEYNVAAAVAGNGTFDFVLVGDSSDEIRFSSRQGSNPPRLVITFIPSTNTPTATRTSTSTRTPTRTATLPPSLTPTRTRTSIVTPSLAPTATRTPTRTATLPSAATATRTSTATRTRTPTSAPTLSGSVITLASVADAQVLSSAPTTNYGSTDRLAIDDPGQESYIRFTVSGVSGSIQSAILRLFVANDSTNGPSIYGTDNSWTESGITWNNRPAPTTGAIANLAAAPGSTWVEFNVTVRITGNGTYSFVLRPDSTDGVTFHSREGTSPPQLVLTLGSGPAPTATLPSGATATRTATRTRTPTSAPTSSGSVVLVGAGDIASCSRNQDEQTAQLLDNIPGTVFTTGDNVYPDGTSTEFTNCYDPTWGRHKSRTKPSPGNHDYHTSGAAGYFQYFNNIPSYYAYDLGAWRIYSLNSEISVSATSAQVTWLQNDLAANPRQCVLAYWHKPRWSSGTNHGNISTMQTLWQTLYNAGAELVINGHEHHYERFAQMNASGAVVSQGLREIVAGMGGASLYPFGTPLAASQVRNNTTYGVLKLTLHATGYDWQFVPVSGSPSRTAAAPPVIRQDS